MALIKCRNCGAEISDRAHDCIHCGTIIVKDVSNNHIFEQERVLHQNIFMLEKEKQDLEAENTRYKIAVATAETQLVNEQSEKEKIATEKDFLVQRNQDLQQAIFSMEQDRKVLETENAQYKTAVTEVSNKLSDAENKKSRLEMKNEELQKRNAELQKQAKDLLKKNKTLETEKNRAKKVKEAKVASTKVAIKIGGVLRLLIVAFFAVGALVSALSHKFGLVFWYGAIAVSVAPYLYRMVWKRIKLDKAVRVAVEIVVPIIVAMLTTVI